VNVLVVFGNQVVSHALKELMATSNGNCHTEAFCFTKKYSPEKWLNFQVIITDYLSLAKIPKECFDHAKVLVMDTGLEQETVVSLFLTDRISGLIPADADVNTLSKAINVVQKGEVWINNTTVKSLLNRSITRKIKNAAKFTERETAIVRLVREGYRNKEIADFLNISEQTVKSHLNRVFRKLDVSSRTELLAHTQELAI